MNYRGVKLASIMTVAIMLLAGFIALVPNASTAADNVASVATEPNGYTIDQAAMKAMWKQNAAIYTDDLSSGIPGADSVGTDKTYIMIDMYTGYLYQDLFRKRGEGDHCEVWVALDLNFTEDLDNSRNQHTSQLTINNSQVQMIIDEFDDNIYPIETQYYSAAPIRNGSESYAYMYQDSEIFDRPVDSFNTTDGHKTMLMVANIRDDRYYDPYYEDGYVAGYYSSGISNIYDRNIIHIDCFDWANRTGADSARPFLYESTVAHEYSHLLQDFVDPDEETWLNEALAMYAEYLCGYGASESHIALFLETPNNSLTIWGDQGNDNILADYGAVMLYTMYLNDHFGGKATLSALFKNLSQGVNSVNNVLKSEGYSGWNFDKVFEAWRLANLIRGNQPGNGLYDYTSIDLDDIAALGTLYYNPSAGWVARSSYFAGEPFSERNSVNAYGTDYVFSERGYMRTLERLKTYFLFQGENDDLESAWMTIRSASDPIIEVPTLPSNSWWWSGEGDLIDRSLTATLDLWSITGSSHTLTIRTAYGIEPEWDFGFVQVSTDEGYSWTSLSNAYTTYDHDVDAMESIVDELPGLTGSHSAVEMNYDLSAYDNQIIQLRFRYMTDWGTTLEGWFIDWVKLDGVVIDNGDGSGAFQSDYVQVETDWIVSMVLYNRMGMPLGIVNINIDSWDMGDYRPWLRRATTEVCFLISPTAGHLDYHMAIIDERFV